MANDTWVLRWHHWSVAMLIHCYDDMLPLPFFSKGKTQWQKWETIQWPYWPQKVWEPLLQTVSQCEESRRLKLELVSCHTLYQSQLESSPAGVAAELLYVSVTLISLQTSVCFSFRSSALLSKGVCFPPMSLFLNKLCSRSLMHHLVELLIPNITHCASYWTNMLQIHAHKYTLALSPVSVS